VAKGRRGEAVSSRLLRHLLNVGRIGCDGGLISWQCAELDCETGKGSQEAYTGLGGTPA
jgi:hypothetical protein